VELGKYRHLKNFQLQAFHPCEGENEHLDFTGSFGLCHDPGKRKRACAFLGMQESEVRT
jgi:hypothetical protein